MYSTQILDNEGNVLHSFLSYDDKWRMEMQVAEITPDLEKALLFKEDKYFYYHPGINFIAVCRALYENMVQGRRTSGASTITMQLARLLSPKSRTYKNKLIEMFRALQLEFTYSKREILQLYLSLVPYGGNVEGLSSASWLYFHKAPKQLSLAELSTLVIIPNRPTSLRLDRHHAAIVQARNHWLHRFQQSQLFPDDRIQQALAEPLQVGKRLIPRAAPHLSYRLKLQYPAQNRIHTFIHAQTQQVLEKLTRQHINSWYSRKVKNAAVIVIDNKKQEIISYVGSADFYNREDAGQVDGVRAIRSPGSTLKPLLYGLAIDKGLITPRTILYDVPSRFGSYFPENYDSHFRGKQTVISALANSLNVPAVQLLDQLGTLAFIEILKKINFQQIEKDEHKLGLSLILGGCGASLEELSFLYSTFAHQGTYQRPSYTTSEIVKEPFQILSEASTYMLADVLTRLDRPDLPVSWKYSSHFPRVAWKTGTSYGRKDAWSIGYSPSYTVGVWVGNFSSEGVPELSGASAAAPLLFNIFDYLEHGQNASWFHEPISMDYRFVCSETGDLPEIFCNNKVLDAYIPAVSHMKACSHMKEHWVSQDSAISYCMSCLPENGFISALYPNYPPKFLRFLRENGSSHLLPPPHNAKCERIIKANTLRITSPQGGTEYLVDKKDQESLLLSCDVPTDVKKLYWYVNDRFYQSARPNEKVFITAGDGKWKISCSDDRGRQDSVWIQVKQIDW